MNISKANYDALVKKADDAIAAMNSQAERADEWQNLAEEYKENLERAYRAAKGQTVAAPRNAASIGGSYSPYPYEAELAQVVPPMSKTERAERRIEELQEHVVQLEKRLTAVTTVIECSGVL